MQEFWETAEKILAYAVNTEERIRRIDKKYTQTVYACGPSGYVGCSQECRGAGERRRSGCMETIVPYLESLLERKRALILSVMPVVEAFESLRGTRSAHVLYYCCGKQYSSQEYGKKFGYSRRHARRLYLRAMTDLYKRILLFQGEDLIQRFEH